MNTILRHALVALLALAFLGSAFGFFTGDMDEEMLGLGIPVWAIRVIGAIKLLGAIALAVPISRFYGAMLLTGTMAGAAITHVVNMDWGGLPPSVFLGILTGLVAWFHQPTWVQERLSGIGASN
jgi:hypothetical protein